MSRQRALALMVLCLLAAAMLRLPGLTETPPGLHYDEAANAVLASEIAFEGVRPVFISSYTGKEVLFFYLAGGLTRLIGSSVFSLRLTAAFIGLLTIAGTYWLGRAMLADRRVAVLAATLLAISFWHLVLSRLGFRAISQPLLQALAVAALFRGLQRPQWRWFLLAGLFLGLAGYTYLAVRLFPILLLLALAPVLVANRPRLSQLAAVAAVALVVLAPLLLYFARYPDAFWVRIGQVAPDASLAVGESFVRSLGMFFLAGDPYWRFNLPGRPLFGWFWGGLGLVGWLSLFWRWRRWWYDWQKASVLLLLLAPLLMLLPTALAVGEIVPSNLRAVGLIPFVFFLPPLGLFLLLQQLGGILRRPDLALGQSLRRFSLFDGYDLNYTFLFLLILLLGTARTERLYFGEWATRADLFYDSDADLAVLARFLDEEAPPSSHLYVAALHYRHPTVAFLSERYEEIAWLPRSRLPGSQALPLPAEGSALYVFPHSSPAPPWAQDILEAGQALRGPDGPDGQPLYSAYLLSQAPVVTVSHRSEANFADTISLLGYDLGEGRSGHSLPLTLYWRPARTPAGSPRPFVHLLDAWDTRWSQVETDPYPAEQWQPGEIIVQRVSVPLPAGLPPGSYRLRLGLFDEQDGGRLPRLDDAGRYAGDSFFVEDARVLPGPPPTEPPPAPRGAAQEVRPGLTLLGYERSDATVAAGERLPLALWWWATEEQPPLTVRLELYDSAPSAPARGRLWLNTTPVRGTYPLSRWATPAFVVDRIDPTVPFDLEAGSYRLQLRLLDAADQTLLTRDLGDLEVAASERLFTAPPLDYPLQAEFGNEIALLGYNWEQTAPESVQLDLVWQAVRQPSAPYYVFVHLLGPDGSCCVWQSDAMPRQGGYPTDRWQAGEVVVDSYQMLIPAGLEPGDYPVEVGLFLLETGRRLQVVVPGLKEDDAVDLQPLAIP